MSEVVPGAEYDVVCPHCSKPFRSELLSGAEGRHRGFKCTHCRLFVPIERTALDGQPEQPEFQDE